MELSFIDELKGVAACCEHEATEKRLNALIAQASAAPEQEPVAWVNPSVMARLKSGYSAPACELSPNRQDSYGTTFPLYTHADPSEVAQLRADLARETQSAKDLWLDCRKLRTSAEAAAQRADAAEQMLRELTDCPWVVEEATIPKAGIEAAPQQVVGTMHVALVRLRKARELLSASAEPTHCMPCGGWGVIAAEPGDAETKCEHCNGTGKEPAKGGDGATK